MHVRNENEMAHGPKTANAGIVFENNRISLLGKTIPNIWLRDNCQCSSCMHETTKQRLQDTFAIPKDLSIKSASYPQRDIAANKSTIQIEWSDGHKSTYTQPFLANAVQDFKNRASIRQGLETPYLWGSDISRQQPTVPYSVAISENMGPVLQNIVSRPTRIAKPTISPLTPPSANTASATSTTPLTPPPSPQKNCWNGSLLSAKRTTAASTTSPPT